MSLPSYNEKVAKTKMQEKSYQDKNGRSRKLWQQCDDKKKNKKKDVESYDHKQEMIRWSPNIFWISRVWMLSKLKLKGVWKLIFKLKCFF